MKKTAVYLSGLNGLRAIAAISVVISHTNLLPGISDFGLPLLFNFSNPLGAYAVTLFFVISGFLITFLLIKEVSLENKIAIKKFYIRRMLRIWPIYYLYLLIVILLLYIVEYNKFSSGIWFYIFFSANIPFIFKQGGINLLLHYWSVGVEEQYYIFWPLFVEKSKKYILRYSIVLFFILLTVKLSFWLFYGPTSFTYRFFNVNRFDCMIVGGIGAIMYYNNDIKFIHFFCNKIIQIFSYLIYILACIDIIHIPYPIAHEILSLAALSIILGQITINKRIVNFENVLFNFIGQISYGIYIIHPLIIMLLSKFYLYLDLNLKIKYMIVYVSVILSTILASWLIYVFFERPFLNLKANFTVVKSSNKIQFDD